MVALVTFMLAEPLAAFRLAFMVAVPTLLPLTRPPEATVATAFAEELQLAAAVTFAVLPSVYVAMAVSCTALPTVVPPRAGVTVIEVGAGAVTVTFADEPSAPRLAWIVAVPTPSVVTTPLASTEATCGAVELQVILKALTGWVVPSDMFSVTENPVGRPSGTVELLALSVIETGVGGPTVKFDVPHTVPSQAVIVAVPFETVYANP